ncbi:MAG: polyribonucleotide nucleotidyltransferase, partial [Ignavibacteria bacterium]
MSNTKSIEIGGKKLTLETGKLAKQANGAVLISYDDNFVLCTVTASEEAKPGQDFFPLTVDYREKTASVGKIPGGFFKREARPTEKEILSSRLIDRPIRPMFPEGFFNEVQLLCSVYSSDRENDSDIIAAIGASAALLISDIPFDEPISEVRVTRLNGELLLNPSYEQTVKGDFDITVAGTSDSIMMVEGEAKEISEEEFLEAIKFAHKNIADLCNFQKEFAKEAGKQKRDYAASDDISEMEKDVMGVCEADLKTVTGTVLSKEERKLKNREIHDKVMTALSEKYPEQEKLLSKIIHDIQYDVLRDMVLNEGKRLDGRGMKDIRQISSEVGLLPRTHGSALFTRGQTQSLTTVTLGTKRDEQMIEGLKELSTKRFILHYNFPPFSTGEV